MGAKNPPLVVIVGETASGKSALAMSLAKKHSGEIVAADSWTVYKGFDVGTAKPSKEDQSQIMHHLLDLAEANEGFNAAKFKDMANEAILDISSRGKVPFLVGGTILYLDSVLYDYSFLATASETERSRLNSMSLEDLIGKAKEDKIDLSGVDVRNKRRVIRAIESGGEKPQAKELRANTLILGVEVSSKDLRKRLTERVDKMLEAGLEKEVESLAEKYSWDSEPMKGIGYREWKDHFEGEQTLEQVRQRIISANVQNLAKRQKAWLKRNKSIQWVQDFRAADKIVTQFLNK